MMIIKKNIAAKSDVHAIPICARNIDILYKRVLWCLYHKNNKGFVFTGSVRFFSLSWLFVLLTCFFPPLLLLVSSFHFWFECSVCIYMERGSSNGWDSDETICLVIFKSNRELSILCTHCWIWQFQWPVKTGEVYKKEYIHMFKPFKLLTPTLSDFTSILIQLQFIIFLSEGRRDIYSFPHQWVIISKCYFFLSCIILPPKNGI